ncbi:MAG: hypothetical protein HY903_04310 [Deltaproteobacteria bacterium]|nr:hypothetical protein [Deltaproteobacteria bacterium]
MKYRYACPSCRTELNPHEDVVVVAKNGDRSGLVLLHPEPGNQRVFVAASLQLKPKDAVRFYCPVCQAELKSAAATNLVRLDYKAQDGSEGFATFSRVYGEHASFYVEKDGAVRAFGESAPLYGDCKFYVEWISG